METTGAQQQFFKYIRQQLPDYQSLADDVAEVLNISNDSAYRRIRGDKPISFEEIQKLCNHYRVSLDRFFSLDKESYIFTGKLLSPGADNLSNYLNNIRENFQYFASHEKKHMFILLKDISPLAYFHIPELAKFKCFFWMKAILQHAELKNEKFYLDDPRYEKFREVGEKIIDLYNKVPMTEIWNVETVNSTLRQIHFYQQSGAFKNPGEIKILYQKMEELVNHFERQAELGIKFTMNTNPEFSKVEYRVFINELIIGDNTYLAELGDTRLTFLNHSVLYFIATRDEAFNRSMFENVQNLMQRSTLISKVGEKERVRFFNSMREKIHHRLNQLN